MKAWLSPEQINALAADPANLSRSDVPMDVDARRPFVPEAYTQLYYTPVYASLHFEHRLRYNQLFGCRINEYIMMLESDLVEHLLIPLQRRLNARGDHALAQALGVMVEEERRHYEVFAALNRACRPDLYPPGRERVFSRLPVWSQGMFWLAGLLANRLAFSLWYLMALEESSTALARDMMRQPETETLGTLDPAFVGVHREHLKDESRHLQIDGLLINSCIGSGGRAQRILNAKLFQSMLRGITIPTRGGAGVKVIREFVREMPELQSREEEMILAVLALRDNEAFQRSLFNRRIMPMTFHIFDDSEELADLGNRLVGYDRR
jgi:P-aminobenzoate N-oxygenase AurF